MVSYLRAIFAQIEIYTFLILFLREMHCAIESYLSHMFLHGLNHDNNMNRDSDIHLAVMYGGISCLHNLKIKKMALKMLKSYISLETICAGFMK